MSVGNERSKGKTMQMYLEEAQQLDQVSRSRWKLQVSASQPEPVLSLTYLFYKNGSGTYGGPRTSADWVSVWSLLYILKQWFPTFLRSRTTWAPRIVNAYHFFQNN